jgi:hypothetical protein
MEPAARTEKMETDGGVVASTGMKNNLVKNVKKPRLGKKKQLLSKAIAAARRMQMARQAPGKRVKGITSPSCGICLETPGDGKGEKLIEFEMCEICCFKFLLIYN